MPRVPHSTDDLADAELAYQRALLHADVDALALLLDDEVQVSSPGGEPNGKDAALEELRSGRLRIRALEVERSRVRVLEELGLSFITVTVRGTHAGVPFSSRERHTRTWRLAEDWVLVASHATMVRD